MQYIITISLVFVTYISFIAIKFGVLPSISESFYRLPKWQWIFFTLFTWGLGLPLILMERDSLLLAAGVCFCFLGVAGAFKMDGIVKWLHNGLAVLGIATCFIFLSKVGLFALFLIFGLSILPVLESENRIWWIEILAFVFIVIGLLITV